MFCANCGNRIDSDSNLCTYCGHKVQQPATHQAASSKEEAIPPDNPTEYQTTDRENNSTNRKPEQESTSPRQPHANADASGDMPPSETSLHEDMLRFTQLNTSYYDRKWRSMDQASKKRSWNFASFFLSLFWMGHRRMYKEMFLLMGLLFVVELGIIFLVNNLTALWFINNGIGLALAIILGIYGNYLYRRKARKKVLSVRHTAESQDEKDALLARKGGTGVGGVFTAIGIFIVYFIIMTSIVFSQYATIYQVKEGSFEAYPDTTLDEAFDAFFDNGEWDEKDSSSSYHHVVYTGEKEENGTNHDVQIDMQIEKGLAGQFQVSGITVDGESLDGYDMDVFLETVFEDSEDTGAF